MSPALPGEPDHFAPVSSRGPSLATLFPTDRPLARRLEECIDQARSADAPVALLLLSPRVRRPTGQRLNARMEAAAFPALIEMIAELVLPSDQVLKVEDGLIAVILHGATGIGAKGVSRKIARRLEGVRDLAGRDVRVRARSACSLFPEEGTCAPDMIWLARARLAEGE